MDLNHPNRNIIHINSANITGSSLSFRSITNKHTFNVPILLPIQSVPVIVDASPSCHLVNFNIGALTTTTRKWDIKVTQYACGDYDKSGWPGCLQYYTALASKIQKYVK